jgi:threonine dehydrogenase-like Zn-dependent dehydrogenase
VAEVPAPAAVPGRVLIRVHSSALCGSENKRYFADPSEFADEGGWQIPGHEMAGEIVDPGDVENFKPGDKAIAQIMNGCGVCPCCKNGTYQFCENLQYEGRTHAEYVSLPGKCAVKAPDDISYDMLVLLGGDTVGVANRALSQLNVKAGQLVFVSGAGPIGLGVTALLKHYGAFAVVSEPSAFRRDFIKRRAKADLVLDPGADNIKEELRSRTGGLGPEIIIECSGNPAAQLDALNLVRCRGTVMLCGENYRGLEIIPSLHVIHKEVTVKGAFYFTASDFYEITALYRGGLDVSGLVSHRAPLKDAPYILEQFVRGLTGKVILHPQE